MGSSLVTPGKIEMLLTTQTKLYISSPKHYAGNLYSLEAVLNEIFDSEVISFIQR